MAITLLPATLAALFLVAGATRPATDDRGAVSCPVILPSHIRVLDCRLAATLAAALHRAPTLQRQFDRIADLQGIVYIATSSYVAVTRKQLRGALSHQVAVSGPICVLRVTLAFDVGDRAVATVAHELHHAIEVLEHADARTEPAIDALFERIGERVGHGIYETHAAIDAQLAVMRELQKSRAVVGQEPASTRPKSAPRSK